MRGKRRKKDRKEKEYDSRGRKGGRRRKERKGRSMTNEKEK